MELAGNGELYECMQNQKITEDQARFYFRQIINGVEYIHRNRITHRDLKPENILMDSNNLVKIGDFGLSNLMKDGKLLKTACGSLNYAAPEIVSERKYEGTSIDIWSSGVILYTLIVGALPFANDNITLLHKKIERNPPTTQMALTKFRGSSPPTPRTSLAGCSRWTLAGGSAFPTSSRTRG
jgi:5'-AMP-activated protein kinase catalytic alpha subunit